MHRIDGYGHKRNRFYVPPDGAIDDDPKTEFTSQWLNSVQEELCLLLESFGVGLQKTNDGQIAALVKSLVANEEKNLEERVEKLGLTVHVEIFRGKEEIGMQISPKITEFERVVADESKKIQAEVELYCEMMKGGELDEDIWWEGEFGKMLSKFYRGTLSHILGSQSPDSVTTSRAFSLEYSLRSFNEKIDSWVRLLKNEMYLLEEFPTQYRRTGG